MRRKLLMIFAFSAIFEGGWFILVPVRGMIAASRATPTPELVATPEPVVAAPQDGADPVATKMIIPSDSPAAKLVAAQAQGSGLSSGVTAYAGGNGYSVRLVGPRRVLIEGGARVGTRTGEGVYVWAVRARTARITR